MLPLPKPSFKAGTTVRLAKDRQKRMAVIEDRYDEELNPGAVKLDRKLLGFRWWNVADLRRVAKRGKR